MSELKELDLQKLAGRMANALWSSVKNWDYFTQDAVGREVAKAADNLWGEEQQKNCQNGQTISIPIDEDETDINHHSPATSHQQYSESVERSRNEPTQESLDTTSPPTHPASIAISIDIEDEIEKEGTNLTDRSPSETNLSDEQAIIDIDIFETPSVEIAFDEEEIETIPGKIPADFLPKEAQTLESDFLSEQEITDTVEIAFDGEEIETFPRESEANLIPVEEQELAEEISTSLAIEGDEEEIETDASIQDLQPLEEDEIFAFPVSVGLDFSDRDNEIDGEIETDSRTTIPSAPIAPPTMENLPPPDPQPQSLRNPEGYEYFLTEARELLAEIERQLFSLTPEASTNEIYGLMRATHTLKGASANVGRETIKIIAHNLEDVFRAMLAPEAVIDRELESMLFEGYECLRLAISAELTSEATDRDDDLLNRAADLFARFQVKLGDCFDHQPPLPTSEELGFDLTKSIFEVGVNQRIGDLKELLSKGANEEAIATTLQEQANVFVGLGESLALPGFGAIATAILAAIAAHPERAREIAHLALEDLECAQKMVLDGDRDRGGQPSPALLELAGETATTATEVPLESHLGEDFDELEMGRELEDLLTPSLVDPTSSVTSENSFSSLDSESPSPLDLDFNPEDLELDIVEEFPIISPQERQELEASFEALELQDTPEEAIEFDLGEPFDPTGEGAVVSDVNLEREFGELEFSKTSRELEGLDLEETFGNLDDIADDFDLDIHGNIKSELESEIETEIALEREISAEREQELIPSDIWDIDEENSEKIPDPELNLAAENLSIEAEIFLSEPETKPTQKNTEDIPSLEETFGSVNLQDTLKDFPTESEPLFLDEPSQPLKPAEKTGTIVRSQTPSPIPNKSSQIQKQKEQSKIPAKTLRIDLEQLELFNHLIAELLINQNQLSLRDEQFQTTVQKLANWIRQHRLTLNQLRDLVNRSLAENESDRSDSYKQIHPLKKVLHSAVEEASQITQATEDINLLAQTTTSTIEREQRLSKQLRDNIQTARTVPLGSLLKRFPPMVKQLSFIHKKSVELAVQGNQVMVDKTIVDNLYDILLHLVRNAFDHGIESPEIRSQRRKSEVGNILIRAYHQGNRTIIDVRDDGGGLNVNKICQQGVKRGLINDREAREIQQLSRPESKLLDLLCSPGFSTVSRVSDLSGRGVGLDVVKTQLEQIKGTLFVRSLPQQGTIFSLQIRESLMNARLLICQAGRSVYGFVSNEIEQILIPGENVRHLAGQKVLEWQQDEQNVTIPIYELVSLLNYSRLLPQCRGLAGGRVQYRELSPILTTRGDISPVLLLKGSDGFIALEVDRILEEQELVIKPLSDALSPPTYIYGCSILADGRLALIIDGFALVSRSQNKEAIAPKNLTSKEIALREETQPENALSTQTLGLYIPETKATEQAITPNLPSSPLIRNTAQVKTVLAIDDSLTERQTLTLILQRSGYRVLQAKDGLEALEQLKSGETIHVILCDIEMPRMNGLEFLSTAKQDKTLSPIPAIILTSRSRDKFQQIALELGAYAYLTKPYLEGEILRVIEEALQTVETKK